MILVTNEIVWIGGYLGRLGLFRELSGGYENDRMANAIFYVLLSIES